jgi:hypothetical protein
MRAARRAFLVLFLPERKKEKTRRRNALRKLGCERDLDGFN